jgi:hypothetical protein
MQLDAKERFKQLSDAAFAVQIRQKARTDSGWYFALSAFLFFPAAFLLPTIWGVGWLLSAIAAAIAGVYGIKGNGLKSVLLFRIGVTSVVTIFSVYGMFYPDQRWGILFTLACVRLAITSLLAFSRYRSTRAPLPDAKLQLASAFSKATRSDPAKTPGLIALQRETGLKLLVPNDDAQYEFRLLFEKDLVFLIGINSFGGLRYSPRIRCIAPSQTFHLDVVGESFGGKRSKVRPMLGPNAIHGDLEITPEMLQKFRETIAQ